jgi:hypothetical protein
MHVWSHLGREKRRAAAGQKGGIPPKVRVIVTADWRAKKILKFLLVKFDRAVRLWRSPPRGDVCWVASR